MLWKSRLIWFMCSTCHQVPTVSTTTSLSSLLLWKDLQHERASCQDSGSLQHQFFKNIGHDGLDLESERCQLAQPFCAPAGRASIASAFRRPRHTSKTNEKRLRVALPFRKPRPLSFPREQNSISKQIAGDGMCRRSMLTG